VKESCRTVQVLGSEVAGASGAGRCGTKMEFPSDGDGTPTSIGRQCRRETFSVSESAAKPGQENDPPRERCRLRSALVRKSSCSNSHNKFNKKASRLPVSHSDDCRPRTTTRC